MNNILVWLKPMRRRPFQRHSYIVEKLEQDQISTSKNIGMHYFSKSVTIIVYRDDDSFPTQHRSEDG